MQSGFFTLKTEFPTKRPEPPCINPVIRFRLNQIDPQTNPHFRVDIKNII
jgi:hypothetical protein